MDGKAPTNRIGARRLRSRTPAISNRLGRGGPRGLVYNRERNPHPFPAEPSGTQNTRKTRKGCGTLYDGVGSVKRHEERPNLGVRYSLHLKGTLLSLSFRPRLAS